MEITQSTRESLQRLIRHGRTCTKVSPLKDVKLWAWSDQDLAGQVSRITKEEAILLPNRTMLIPGDEDGSYIGAIYVFHYLHCLVSCTDISSRMKLSAVFRIWFDKPFSLSTIQAKIGPTHPGISISVTVLSRYVRRWCVTQTLAWLLGIGKNLRGLLLLRMALCISVQSLKSFKPGLREGYLIMPRSTKQYIWRTTLLFPYITRMTLNSAAPPVASGVLLNHILASKNAYLTT